jgi:uncharacterized protein YecE (DUF72 family)
MEFGKLPDISQVDFSLPPDAPGTLSLLQAHPALEQWPFYIGATGWAMKEWVGTYYPKGTAAKDFLAAYGTQFNTIELNTTHYRIPEPAAILRWKTQTPDDFRFCPKIPQTISHSRDLGTGGTQLHSFAEVIALLENRLGPSFMQLPPHFSPIQLPILESFLKKWPQGLPLAIEFRHPDWFCDTGLLREARELLSAFGTGTVITDVAGRRDVLHMCLTAPFAFIRFVGNALHPSDYERVGDWIRRLEHWFENGLQRVFFFTHEPDNLQAPELAAFLGGHLAQSNLPWKFRAPQQENKKPFNGQIRLF